MRGRSRVAQYQTDEAIGDFTQAAGLNPRDTRPWVERGRAYLLKKKYDLAIADAAAALAADANLAPAYNLRGMALRELGKRQEALDDFNHAVALSPTADNYYQRGATLQLLEEHRRAIADFSQTIAYHPDIAQAYFARAESERGVGDYASARKDHLRGRILDGR